jgi:hypothetical protein
MAKRFTDTNKYKKPFMRGLPGAYKLLWDFLYHDCDFAGIWIVDFEIAQSYVGKDMPIDRMKALRLFNSNDEIRVVELDMGKKWFIPSFIEFQYVELSRANRAHASVITTLTRFGLIDDDLKLKTNKPHTSPFQGAKEKEKDKDKELDKEKEKSAIVILKDGPVDEIEFNYIFSESLIEMKSKDYAGLDIGDQLIKFKSKIRGSPKYRNHTSDDLKLAFDYQLRQQDQNKTTTPKNIIADRKRQADQI